ncbi:MAG: 4Fe-4S dicluster domain-containing protein, partial [Bacteroidales bacterium]
YYRQHPEFKEPDDRARQSPGLLSPSSKQFHAPTFLAAESNFRMIDTLASLCSGENVTQTAVGSPSQDVNPAGATRFVLGWLRKNRAHSAGITFLRDHHLYSHKGRGAHHGEPIQNHHQYAIALTVEMDHQMMQSAPAGPSVMESSEQYLHSGVLALKLALFIRKMGYGATAHIDGNYEVICPLVAMDAGLGTIGRMGLLITPRLGPRVRIAVVTTDMPLLPSKGGYDPTILHFCENCRKCATNCPVTAIPEGPRTRVDGTTRWRINSEKCYQFWTVSGTDCGRCISVCPYSHPDNFLHRFVRWGIKNNLLFRHLAIKLEDVIYSRRPVVRPLTVWADMMDKQ